MVYPESHKKIVEELLDGKFVLSREEHYNEIKENEEFYFSFFKASFGHELQITNEFARLISEETDENLSRDISIFFAIISYEMDKQGKNFLDTIQYSEFSMEEINSLFEESSWIDLVHSNKHLKDSDARKRFIFSSMGKRNIIDKIADERFGFTAAYKVFMEYAKDLAQRTLDDKRDPVNS